MAPQCTALNVSDEKRCVDVATSLNGLFCSSEGDRPHDLFFDFRWYLDESKMPEGLKDPHSVQHFKDRARAFATGNPGARFAVVR